MHALNSYLIFQKGRALTTAPLCTTLHLKQKRKQEPQQNMKTKYTLKNHKSARKYSGGVYKLIAIFVENC